MFLRYRRKYVNELNNRKRVEARLSSMDMELSVYRRVKQLEISKMVKAVCVSSPRFDRLPMSSFKLGSETSNKIIVG